jgi:hypothetical protein
MTRGQETQAFNTASSNNATNEATAQQAEQQQQAGINNYGTAVAKYAANNPYVQGGQLQTAQNAVTSNTSDAAASALQGQLQQQAQRTGQNPNAANATASSGAQAIARNLGAQQASDTASRIGSEAQYNQSALNATGQIPGMEGSLASTAGGQANQQLGTEEQAGQTPSFGEMLTSSLLSAGGSFAGGIGQGVGKSIGCWIAAAVFEQGWEDPRTHLVRQWIFGPFAASGIIPLMVAKSYMRYGERVAAVLHRYHKLKWPFRKLMELALRKARRWELGD